MAIFVDKKRVHFHKTYMDRVPKTNIVNCGGYDGTYKTTSFHIRVFRNLRKSQFFWIVDYGVTQVYWSDVFDVLHEQQMVSIIYGLIDKFCEQMKKDPYYEVCKSVSNGD